ncbi:DUF2213 domain-containing protein [Bilophila wadsworthia]|nr:MAG TPA: hypothetical protein [Caudoviricetes sp.]
MKSTLINIGVLFLRPACQCRFMRYHTQSRLSEHMFETPEGFLLCPGVAIARTGPQPYAADEVADDVEGVSDVVVMLRDEDEVFDSEAMASFEGKPLVIDHPDEDVNPDNWKELAVGHVQNVRRGEGIDDDLLIADILVTDAEAIRLIRKEGLRELSCGYDARNEAVRPGMGRQTDIRGNHVALVPHGRCGARCRINDRKGTMAKKPSWWDRIMGDPKVRKAMRDAEEEMKAQDEGCPNKDEDDPKAATATDEGDPVAEKLDEVLMLLRTLVEGKSTSDEDDPKSTEDEDTTETNDDETVNTGDNEPDGTSDEDDPARTTDRAMRRRTADADTLRRAATLAPGHAFRMTDKACTVKRIALRDACRDKGISRIVDACLRGTDLERCDCMTLDAAFIAASEVAANRANRRTADALTRASVRDFGKAVSPADINKANRDFYKRG